MTRYKEKGIVDVKMFFDNGYGVFIIRKPGSYGYPKNQYEVAVLIGDEKQYELCYTTYITNDVLGYLTKKEVTETIAKVKEL